MQKVQGTVHEGRKENAYIDECGYRETKTQERTETANQNSSFAPPEPHQERNASGAITGSHIIRLASCLKTSNTDTALELEEDTSHQLVG